MLRSAGRITRMAPSPLGSGAPSRSTSVRSQGPQSFQALRSEVTPQTVSRGALECAEASTPCFAISCGRLQPLARPGLQGANGRLESAALLVQAVLDAHRCA